MSHDSDPKALNRERKFGGGSRWICTFAAIASIPIALWFIPENSSFAIFIGILGLMQAVFAVINWRNWLRKSEAEKAPLRFMTHLKVKEITIPFTRFDFNHARKAARLNLSITAIAFLYTICGAGLLFVSLGSLPLRIGGIVIGVFAAWVFWQCGRRFLAVSKSLTCPGCKDLLTTQADSVLKTGCCRKCNRTVLTD